MEVKAKVRFCATCGNVAQEELCGICRDPRRDLSVICVVEEPKDVVAVERTREFRGKYHVLAARSARSKVSDRTTCVYENFSRGWPTVRSRN